MKVTIRLVSTGALYVLALSGCHQQSLPGDYGPSVQFQDQVVSNAQPEPAQLSEMMLTKGDGSTLRLKELGVGKNILLVISRGLVGSGTQGELEASGKSFCIYCSTQTSRLVANYAKFKARNTEVVVVFPVARRSDNDQLQNFAAKVKGEGSTSNDFPFPVVLDVELMAVDALGIRDDLSKPSTYILDSQGALKFGYVGQSISDRPSIQALLEQLDQINK